MKINILTETQIKKLIDRSVIKNNSLVNKHLDKLRLRVNELDFKIKTKTKPLRLVRKNER
ncbi:unnamed protein product [marine sediment metagenome]|uniref:Uncharacterized protein n=1 Tax=marine sediment metagenome TaxID=412755 RepID=X1AME5_9ZZZZ